MKLRKIYLSAVYLNMAVFLLLFIFMPSLRSALTAEDLFIENLSAGLFLCACFISMVNMLKPSLKIRKRIYIAIPFLCLLGALEELSFGSRVFGWSLNTFFDIRIGNNIHEHIRLVYVLLMNHPVYYPLYAVLGTACLITVLYVTVTRRARIKRFLSEYVSYQYVLTALGIVTAAFILDVALVQHPLLVFTEELLEMNAALTLLFASLAIKPPKQKQAVTF